MIPEPAVRDRLEPRLQASDRVARTKPRLPGIAAVLGATVVAIAIAFAVVDYRSTSSSPSPSRSAASAPPSSSTQASPPDLAPKATSTTPTSTAPAAAPEAKAPETATAGNDAAKQGERPDAVAASAPSTADAQQAMPSATASSPAADAQAPPAASAPTVPSIAPSIARIGVPRAIVGRPFVIAINLDPESSRDIVAIEREVLQSTARWPEQVKVTAVSSLTRSKAGALLYPVAAIDRRSRSTLQFTPIDKNGERGIPKRVAFRTDSAAGQPGSVECPRASTCGSVIAVREIEAKPGTVGRFGERAAPAYEVVIGMDDRSISRVMQDVPWRTGTRVRKFGSQFVQIKSGRR